MNAGNHTAIEQRLQEIMDRSGVLTPDAVIEDARDPNSPLHGEFEWDADKAAMEYWRDQARRLIRSVHVTVTLETHTVATPRYVRKPGLTNREQGYIEPASIKSDHQKAMESLAFELQRAEGAIRRAENVAIALGLDEEARSILEQLLSFKSHVQAA